MKDPDCGIQRWYLKPSFLVKVILGILAFATLIRLFVIDSVLYQHVWRKPIKNGNMAGTITFFFILTIIITVLIHFNSIMERIPFIGTNVLYQVIIAGCVAGLTLLLALIFGGKNVSSSNFNKLCNEKTGKFWVYWSKHSTDKKYVQWLEKHKSVSDKNKYFRNRTKSPGQDVLGLFIVMAIFDAILLFYFCNERKTNGFRPVDDQNDQYLNQSYKDNEIQ